MPTGDRHITRMQKNRKKYRTHKSNAKRRGIKFELSFEEWVSILVGALGEKWYLKYGRKKLQYCVSRIGDRGSYIIGNVRVVTNTQNHSERVMSEEGRKSVSEALSNRIV